MTLGSIRFYLVQLGLICVVTIMAYCSLYGFNPGLSEPIGDKQGQLGTTKVNWVQPGSNGANQSQSRSIDLGGQFIGQFAVKTY